MGVDLHVYTPSEEIVTSEELGRQLRSEGWEVRFVLDQEGPVLEPAHEGPLIDVLDVIGWSISAEKANLAAEAIDRRDLKSLQSLYDEGTVASCGYSVVHPFNFEEESERWDTEEEEDEDEEPIEEWCLEAMRQATTRYGLRVRIRSSNRSYQFLRVVWRAVGQLRDGLLVDPQFGEYRRAKDNP